MSPELSPPLIADELPHLSDVCGADAAPHALSESLLPLSTRRTAPFEAARRWFYLLRYHRASQFAWRIVSRGQTWWLRKTRGGRYTRRLPLSPALRPDPALRPVLERKLSNRRKQGACEKAQAVLEGRFRFLNQELCFGDSVDWRLEGRRDVDPLWRFQLHYHEFLLDLLVAAIDTDAAVPIERAWQLVLQWIAANPLTEMRTLDDAWHPFCISRRLPVWIVLWEAKPPVGESARMILECMYRQALFLAAHLERDLGGNHLIENARALAMAGSFLDGPDADHWLGLSRRILYQELPEQILPHGEHFERSPMYHAQTLDALLDIGDALTDLAPDLAQSCGAAALCMAEFLETILHPDDEIPLLGDSALRESPPARLLIQQANDRMEPKQPVCNSPLKQGDRHLATLIFAQDSRESLGASPLSQQADGARRSGDYWVWRNADDFLLLDAGPVGADHLPAHAHSDLLTIEASIAGRRFIVDSGVFAYRDDELRRYCRSTAAHNVLQVDGREQCDTWSRFRMGHRGHPTAVETGRVEDFEWVRCGHDAYRRLGVPFVGRWIACRPGGPWLIVDWAEGRGEHQLTNWLHLHPDVQVEKISAMEIRLRLGADVVRLAALAPGNLDLLEGLYCSEFGHRIPAPVVRWMTTEKVPAACGWWLSFGEAPGTAVLQAAPSGVSSLHWSSSNGELAFEPAVVFGAKRR